MGNFIAIGLNYSDHAAEAGMPIPKEPIIFNKAPSCLCGPNDDTIIPRDSTKLDWEIELGIVIGTRARYLSKDKALDVVAGYCLANDVSERVFQIERAGQWTKGKGCETFGPLGPWLVTKDEIKDPQKLNMWLNVNGEKRQRGNTSTMIFDCRHIVWCCSQYFILEPGDVIITGTPPGVGLGMKPPTFLKAGDVVTLGIDGLGEQKQKVVKGKNDQASADTANAAPPDPVPVTLNPATTALLIFDIVDPICSRQPNCTGKMVPAISSLLARARQAGVTVAFGTRAPTMSNWLPEVCPAPGDIKIESQAQDRFYNTDLDKTLKAKGITTLILAGWKVSGSVTYTSVGATLRGYTVVVPVDASLDATDYEIAIGQFQILHQHSANAANEALKDKASTLSRTDLISFK